MPSANLAYCRRRTAGARARRTADLSEYATRLEERALGLAAHLAREALADAAWARQNGPGLGLLARRGYLVVPAESVPGARLLGRLGISPATLGPLVRGQSGIDQRDWCARSARDRVVRS